MKYVLARIVLAAAIVFATGSAICASPVNEAQWPESRPSIGLGLHQSIVDAGCAFVTISPAVTWNGVGANFNIDTDVSSPIR